MAYEAGGYADKLGNPPDVPPLRWPGIAGDQCPVADRHAMNPKVQKCNQIQLSIRRAKWIRTIVSFNRLVNSLPAFFDVGQGSIRKHFPVVDVAVAMGAYLMALFVDTFDQVFSACDIPAEQEKGCFCIMGLENIQDCRS